MKYTLPTHQTEILCKEAKSLAQQSVLKQSYCQVTELHAMATPELKHEYH